MTDYINLQSRCQRGESTLAGANNLLAECHAALGKLLAEVESLRKECSRLAADNQALLENPEDAL
ncbi:hypothetical protein SAMN03159444_00111 [Pseudomonas sp. NFACC02]|uniref:hypothetical protein n=1 Tax=Pseudomonas sp. NFACC02 TaxID=1566250 RepID=UPI0008D8B593|nr:hypothetical protein [Pseudomonas sp. NFACC02]SEP57960.1 hypothetical protein SAMN03159444_00111 [Pseudomonas sp. NFACC02]